MPKLHEGLAIYKDRQAVVRKIFDEAEGVFKTAAHFHGFTKTTRYFDAADQERFGKVEEKVVDETVPSKLSYVGNHFAQLLDLDYQMEKANQTAVSDFIIDGRVIAQKVPVNFLLTIENKFKEFRAVLDKVPTHAPGVTWNVDTEKSSNRDVFRAAVETKDFLTKKVPVYQVVVAATEHHPAQVANHHEDVRVAEVVQQRFTSTITSAQKADILARCDKIIMAAKRARQRANNVDLPREKIAAAILDYALVARLPDAAAEGDAPI